MNINNNTTMNYGQPSQRPGVPESTATGPRAKCDQVVFEALCKACEMIVASRGEQPQAPPHGKTGSASSSNVSSRFNLTLPEHASVRQILQKWRRALHLPLRLDVYYQHENNTNTTPTTESGEDGGAPPQRELLERWCLVYALPSSEEWMHYQQQQQQQQQRAGYNKMGSAAAQATTALSQDPIVQLRQVCKKIVIWLRTLYCMARLLPATTFLHAKSVNIGFSLYAVSEGTDDDVQLQQQGFLCQPADPRRLSYVVGTPYGVLTWKVLTAEASVIHRLSSQGRKSRGMRPTWNFPTATVSRAIPIHPSSSTQENHSNHAFGSEEEEDEDYHYYEQAMNHHHHHNNNSQEFQNNHRYSAVTGGGVPQSAPAHFMWSAGRTQQQAQQQNINAAQGGGKSSGGSGGSSNGGGGAAATATMAGTHGSGLPPNTYQQPSQFRERVARQSNQQLQRRHTSIGQEGVGRDHETSPTRPIPVDAGEAKRVLSGLSLAMMTLEEKNHHAQNGGGGDNAHGSPQDATMENAKDKRRAALHQAPPHRRSPQDDSAAAVATSSSSPSHHHHHHHHHPSAGHNPATAPQPQPLTYRDSSQEYGYAYNNHIPWQKIHPSAGHPALQQRGDADFDSSPRANTPSALGTTPPPMLLNPGSLSSNPASLGKHFLPPRSGNTGAPLTPPFPNRPGGFAAAPEPPVLSLNHNHYQGSSSSPQQQQQQHGRMDVPQHGAHDAMPQPLTSLDLLHQSPFSWNPNTHGSMLSSLTMPDSSAAMDLRRSLMLTQQPADFFSSGVGNMDWADEMPFAVEETGPSLSAAEGESPALDDLVSLAASTAVASLAQKCATSQRLQLFESRAGTDMIAADALASQLAEFRAFGASLSPNETTPSSSSVATNTTPTALRT